LHRGLPGQAAARADLTGHRDQPAGQAAPAAELLHAHGVGGGGKGDDKGRLFLPHGGPQGRTTRPAELIFSTISYMLVTPPTCSLSLRPKKFRQVPQVRISTPWASRLFRSSREAEP